MKNVTKTVGLVLVIFSIGYAAAYEPAAVPELEWRGGYYEGLGGAIEGDDVKDKTFKVKFSDVKFGAFVAVYGQFSSVIDVWITGPEGGELQHEQFVPGNLGGSKWTSGVIKLRAANRGDEFTIRVKTNSDAIIFTSHELVEP